MMTVLAQISYDLATVIGSPFVAIYLASSSEHNSQTHQLFINILSQLILLFLIQRTESQRLFRSSFISVSKESACTAGDPDSWVGTIRQRRDRLSSPVFLGFSCDSAGKECACNAGDLGSTPWLGRSPGEGKDYPLQYFDLENSMGCIVHGVTKSWT